MNALPYRSRHAIFVREGAHRVLDAIDLIPDVLRIRPISLRGFSENGEMVDADLVDGDALAPLIERFFENPAIVYLQPPSVDASFRDPSGNGWKLVEAR